MHCDQCARRGDDVPTDWPEGAFFTEDVSNWRVHKTPLKCAACKLDAGEIATEILTQLCQRCEKTVELKGPPHGFSPILVCEFLEGGKTVQGSRIFKDRWRCFNCQYPRCTVSTCKARPEFAGPSHTCYTKDGEYMCPSCRYPPCTGCGKERPKKSEVQCGTNTFVAMSLVSAGWTAMRTMPGAETSRCFRSRQRAKTLQDLSRMPIPKVHGLW